MIASSEKERFTNVDAAWLHMETPTNMAMITGVMTFDEHMNYTRLRAIIEKDLLAYERFRQKVDEPPRGVGLPFWTTDSNIDLDWHIQRVQLPEPADQKALQALVSDLMSTPLDFSRPLWQMHLVENYRPMGAPGAALISRLHHCIADGIALMQVMLSLTDDKPDAPGLLLEERAESSSKGAFDPLLAPLHRTRRGLARTWDITRQVVDEGLRAFVHPARMLELARLGVSGTRALGKLLLIGPDRRTRLKGKCGARKSAAWSRPIPLDDVKRVGKLMNATVNDVLLACVTGALRRYLAEHGEPVEDVNIRAVVPVSIRPDGDFEQLGNRFGLVFLSLPVYERDILRRLRVLKRRMDAIKNSPEAIVAFNILATIGMTPVQIEKIIVGIFGMKGTAVMTNVPGPQKQLYLAGSAMNGIMFWVPQPAGLGMGVSIISYNHQVMLGIATDVGLVPDPEAVIAGFENEFAEIATWGRPARRPELAAEAAAYGPAKTERCQAITQAGTQCKNRAQKSSPFCHVHYKLV